MATLLDRLSIYFPLFQSETEWLPHSDSNLLLRIGQRVDSHEVLVFVDFNVKHPNPVIIKLKELTYVEFLSFFYFKKVNHFSFKK